MTKSARHLTSVITVLVCGAGALTGCSAAKDAAGGAQSAGTATIAESVKPSSAGSSSASSSDTPIGGGDINLGTAGPTNYPADQLSRPGATDCYSGGSRIYDRHGITCDGARRALAAYEATAASSKGTEQKIGEYVCSHNPEIMVNQGAAPGKCVDSSANVVFNWRYPGAPLPARG